ncbi:hypothetical protein RB653_006482 [Dictyostelium firmibasis]|uniref:P-loop containing nucleoside triphosphate hydrolase protein n=1 Tax=Dictyostelium firmibasis TaxID=79012 RepID=A0AAN7U2T5_9MYCE
MNEIKEYDHTVKIIITGDTGKSSFISRAIDDLFINPNSTPYLPYHNSNPNEFIKGNIFSYNNLLYLVNLHEYYQEKFRTINNNSFRGANCNFILYDVCNQKSFDNVIGYYQESQRYGKDGIHLFLIGVKIDDIENRIIDYETASTLARSYDMSYFEVNNKSPSPLEKEIYQKIIETAIKKIHEEYLDSEPPIIQINKKSGVFGLKKK